MTEKQNLTPREQALKDAAWHLGRAAKMLSWPWPFRIFGARHHFDQARLAVNALQEEGEAEVHRVQR